MYVLPNGCGCGGDDVDVNDYEAVLSYFSALVLRVVADVRLPSVNQEGQETVLSVQDSNAGQD